MKASVKVETVFQPKDVTITFESQNEIDTVLSAIEAVDPTITADLTLVELLGLVSTSLAQ